MTTLVDREARESQRVRHLESRVRVLTITVATLAVLLLGLGVWLIIELTSTAEVQPIPKGTVSITLESIAGVAGWDIAGVLYETPGSAIDDIVGGFLTTADSDPFTTTQTITATPLFYSGIRSTEPVLVEPGTYLLRVFAAEDMGGYSIWMPGNISQHCQTVVEVGEREGTSVTITGGIAGFTEGSTFDDTPACNVTG
jgi:hypothetical protein